MALFRPGALIGAITGNLGGVNFATSSKRPIVRQARRRPNQEQPRLAESRAHMQRLTDAWAAATTAQRHSWDALATNLRLLDRLAQARQPTGRELHASWNLTRMLCGLAIETAVVPAFGVAPAVVSLASAGPSPGHISVSCIHLAVTGATIYGILYGGVRFQRGTSRNRPKLKFVTAQVPDFGSNTFTFDVTTAWSSQFGEPQTGQTYWVGVRLITDLMLVSEMTVAELVYP